MYFSGLDQLALFNINLIFSNSFLEKKLNKHEELFEK